MKTKVANELLKGLANIESPLPFHTLNGRNLSRLIDRKLFDGANASLEADAWCRKNIAGYVANYKNEGADVCDIRPMGFVTSGGDQMEALWDTCNDLSMDGAFNGFVVAEIRAAE